MVRRFAGHRCVALVLVGIGLLRQDSTLQQDLASLRAQFADQGNKLEQANEVVATLLDPDATKIELVAVGSKPQPRGKAIYQRRNRNLIFFASNLPPLPAEKIYELWLFPANGGAPIAAGLVQARCSRQRDGRESSAAGGCRGQELCGDAGTRERLARISAWNACDRGRRRVKRVGP